MMSPIKLTLLGVASTLLTFSFTAKADPQEVYDLAQGCYAIQSPHNDNYVRRYQSGGSVNGGWSFDFKANNAEQAAKFYFKPSGLETYMMRDEGGRYLDTRFFAEITGGNVVGKHANWRLDGRMHNGEHQVRFTSHALDRWLRHNWNSQGIYFIDLLNPRFNNSEEWFRLDRKSTRLNSSHVRISYAVFCLKKKKKKINNIKNYKRISIILTSNLLSRKTGIVH